MKQTTREIVLLFLLGAVGIILIGVYLLILPLNNSNLELKETLSILNDQLITVQTDQQITGTADTQIEEEILKTDESIGPFLYSVRPEQLTYWLDGLLTANNMEMNAIEFTDIASAAPDFEMDRPTPPAGNLELPIENTTNVMNGENAPAPQESPAQPTDDAAAQTETDGTAAAPETYCTQVILNATGSYEDISNFMNALYADGRALTVDSLTITDYQEGGKMAAIAIRFFGAPLPDDAQEKAYSFPVPAGQSTLMEENETPEVTPEEETQEPQEGE
jgi:hypothetical protein